MALSIASSPFCHMDARGGSNNLRLHLRISKYLTPNPLTCTDFKGDSLLLCNQSLLPAVERTSKASYGVTGRLTATRFVAFHITNQIVLLLCLAQVLGLEEWALLPEGAGAGAARVAGERERRAGHRLRRHRHPPHHLRGGQDHQDVEGERRRHPGDPPGGALPPAQGPPPLLDYYCCRRRLVGPARGSRRVGAGGKFR
eukprot:1195082-Prorocentrum_minimum.AAC.8